MRLRHAVPFIVAVALIAGSAGLASAEGPRRGPWDRGPMMGGPLGPLGRALQEVSLTQEQQDKIHALVDAQRPILRTLRDQLRESEQAFRQAHPITEFDEAVIRAHVAEQAKIMADLEVASAGLRSKVLALVTGEQLAELKEVLAETPERVGPGDGPHGW